MKVNMHTRSLSKSNDAHESIICGINTCTCFIKKTRERNYKNMMKILIYICEPILSNHHTPRYTLSLEFKKKIKKYMCTSPSNQHPYKQELQEICKENKNLYTMGWQLPSCMYKWMWCNPWLSCLITNDMTSSRCITLGHVTWRPLTW